MVPSEGRWTTGTREWTTVRKSDCVKDVPKQRKTANCKGMVGAQVAPTAFIKEVNEWDDSQGVLTSERTLHVWWGQP